MNVLPNDNGPGKRWDTFLGIDLNDTTWIEQPPYTSDIANPGKIERTYYWIQNHEATMLIWIIFVLVGLLPLVESFI